MSLMAGKLQKSYGKGVRCETKNKNKNENLKGGCIDQIFFLESNHWFRKLLDVEKRNQDDD